MKHRICLDKCLIQPKLIKDGIVMDQHDGHHIEPIDKIQNRLNEPANKMIVDEFLADSLDSILAKNEGRKQQILKNFATTVSEIFDDIERSLTQIWNHKKPIVDTIRSLLPEYDQDQLSQIQGDFSFLRVENIGALKQISIDQSNLMIKANTQVDDLVLQIEKLLIRYQPTIAIIKPTEKPIQLMRQVIFGQWEGDGLQELRVIQASSFQKYFSFTFQRDKGLKIEKKTKGKEEITKENLSQMVSLCVAFKPSKLLLDLRETEVNDISPLSSIQALVNLTSLQIYLQFQSYLISK